MFITFGLLLLTALYVGMVFALKYTSPVECFDDLCQSEGVDNTILNWASDFFLAFWTFVFALHLTVCIDPEKKEIRKSGILTQVFMGGTFVMAGIGHWLYPNSGMDDNHGLLGYWIVWIVSKVLFVVSGLTMAHFALTASKNTNPVLKKGLCTKNFLVALCELSFVLSLSGLLTGGIWCSTEPDLHVNEVIDNFDEQPIIMGNDIQQQLLVQPLDFEQHICFRIANYSDVAMYFTYALLWFPVGFHLKAASRNRPVILMGLPSPIAAVIAMVAQWTVGSVLMVAFFCVDVLVPTKEDYFDAWNLIYGTVLYHWAMLMTMCCLHNLSHGLPLRYKDAYDSDNTDEGPADEGHADEGPAPLSWEWWVTMVAGAVPEPKEKSKNYEEKEFCDEENTNSGGQEEQQPRIGAKTVSFDMADEVLM